METKRFHKDEVIFREGSLGSVMYEIQSGSVGIFAAYGTENEKKLTELEAGRIFGEMALIEVFPRSATAVALDEVEATEISTGDLGMYFGNQPEKIMEIMRGMSRRVRELTADYQEVCGSIRAWKDANEQGQEKPRGLVGRLKRFAAVFAEAASYMASPTLGTYYNNMF